VLGLTIGNIISKLVCGSEYFDFIGTTFIVIVTSYVGWKISNTNLPRSLSLATIVQTFLICGSYFVSMSPLFYSAYRGSLLESMLS